MTMNTIIRLRRVSLVGLVALLTLARMSSPAKSDHGNSERQNSANHYQQINLVSDIPGLAILDDSDLVNAWGISFSTTSPFWISDNGTGKTTLYAITYDALGVVQVAKQGLFVNIPGEGNPTGQLFNG